MTYKKPRIFQIQSDWNQSSNSARDYIKNKPSISIHSHSNKAELDSLSGTNTGDETNQSIKNKLGTDLSNKYDSSNFIAGINYFTPYEIVIPVIDNVTNDNTTVIQNTLNNAPLNSVVRLPYSINGYYKTTNTITVPVGVSFVQDAMIKGYITADIPVLVVGANGVVNANQFFKLNAQRSAISDWSNEDNISIKIINANACFIDIVNANNSTIGLQMIGVGQGHVFNETHIMSLINNKVSLDITNESYNNTIGWANNNLFFNGHINANSGTRLSSSRIGIRITSKDSTYSSNNNNIFYSPSFEFITTNMTQAAAEASYPIQIVQGQCNHFLSVREEDHSPYFKYIAQILNQSESNRIEIRYGGYGGGNIEDLSDYPTTVYKSGRIELLKDNNPTVFTSKNLADKVAQYGTNLYHVADFSGIKASNGEITPYIQNQSYPVSNGYLVLNNSFGIGRYLDTSKFKNFVVKLDALETNGGRIGFVCFDSSGNKITPNYDTDNTQANHVKGYAWAPPYGSSYYGGCYHTGSDNIRDRFFNFADEIDHVFIFISPGTNGCYIKSFSIINTDEGSPVTWLGYESIVDGGNIGTQSPTVGTYLKGKVVWNANPTVGSPIGWRCTNEGTDSEAIWEALTIPSVANFLQTVSIDSSLSGNGTSGNPLSVVQSNIVHIDSTETITGTKTFSNPLTADNLTGQKRADTSVPVLSGYYAPLMLGDYVPDLNIGLNFNRMAYLTKKGGSVILNPSNGWSGNVDNLFDGTSKYLLRNNPSGDLTMTIFLDSPWTSQRDFVMIFQLDQYPTSYTIYYSKDGGLTFSTYKNITNNASLVAVVQNATGDVYGTNCLKIVFHEYASSNFSILEIGWVNYSSATMFPYCVSKDGDTVYGDLSISGGLNPASGKTIYDLNQNVSNAVYTNNTISLAVTRCKKFSTDGTKLYAYSSSTGYIRQYNCSTPFDESTAVDAGNSYRYYIYGNVDQAVWDFEFNSDGTIIYVVGAQNAKIYQLVIQTAWNLSTITTSGMKFLYTGNENATPKSMTFSVDKTKLFVLGVSYNRVLHEYKLITPGDVSTGVYTGNSTTITSVDSSPQGIQLINDDRLYISGNTNKSIYEWIIPNAASLKGMSVTPHYTKDLSSVCTAACYSIEIDINGDMHVCSGTNCYKFSLTGTSGMGICTQPMQGISYKKVEIYLNSLNGSFTYSFPTAFTYIPQIVSQSLSSKVTSLSTTLVTITATGESGFIELTGF